MQEKEKKVKNQEEKILDVKGTIESFIEEEPPEMSQEDAIKEYRDYPQKKKKGNNDEDEGESEEEEHLKRVKKELLASLERVDQMSHKIFDEKDKDIKKVKVKMQEKDKEKVMEQMREKVQEEKAKEGREKE